MTENLLISSHAFVSHDLMPFLVDKTLFPWKVNLFTSFRGPPLVYIQIYFIDENSFEDVINAFKAGASVA